MEYEFGVHHPRGGTGAVMAAMAKAATEMGVRIRLNEPVEEILFQGRKAVGVRTKAGEYKAEAAQVLTVVCKFFVIAGNSSTGMTPPAQPVVYLLDFALEPTNAPLSQGKQPVALRPKTLAVLAHHATRGRYDAWWRDSHGVLAGILRTSGSFTARCSSTLKTVSASSEAPIASATRRA